MEPFRVMFDEECNEEDPQDIKGIADYPSKRDIPYFMLPSAPNSQDKTHPNKGLLESGATPYNRCTVARIETDRVSTYHVCRVSYKADQPIDHRRYMVRHKHERSGHIQSKPCNLITTLVSYHGELPEVIRHQ